MKHLRLTLVAALSCACSASTVQHSDSSGPPAQAEAQPSRDPLAKPPPGFDPEDVFGSRPDADGGDSAVTFSPACRFRVQSVPGGISMVLEPGQMTLEEIEGQARRLARAFQRSRAGALPPVGNVRSVELREIMSLRPYVRVDRSAERVRLVFTPADRSQLEELRARVRWYSTAMIADPILEETKRCAALPDSIERWLAVGAGGHPRLATR